MNSIRGSDVFVKEDMRAGFGALQRVAAAYPPGEYRAGFLAALDAVRVLFDIKADGLADLPDLPPAMVDSVRVLPPVAAPALAVAEVDDPPPAGWRRLNVAPVVPVEVAEADRVVEVEHGDDPVVVRPDRWRLVTWGAEGFVYDEIAGPGRYVLPAGRWVPVPVAWRGRMGVELVPDQWALFVTIDWAIRRLGRARVERLPDGRAQITG